MESDVLNVTDNNTTQTTVDEILSVDGQNDEDNSKIFEKPWLLEIDNLPDANRIVGRDNKIKSLAKNLRKMRTDEVPDNIVMWGETGTGKTLVARHVCERLEVTTQGTDGSIVTAYVNPDPISTYTSTFRKIAEQVNAKANDPVDVPSLGLSAEHYRNKKLWPIVKKSSRVGSL
jgi:ORC complex protein Cdc6/Orc1